MFSSSSVESIVLKSANDTHDVLEKHTGMSFIMIWILYLPVTQL